MFTKSIHGCSTEDTSPYCTLHDQILYSYFFDDPVDEGKLIVDDSKEVIVVETLCTVESDVADSLVVDLITVLELIYDDEADNDDVGNDDDDNGDGDVKGDGSTASGEVNADPMSGHQH